jgi:membrane protein DedA with SNARE-associated domain
MVTAAVAGFCGDQAAFFAGRRWGPRLLAWSPRLAAAQPVIAEKLERHSAWVVFVLRFAVGLRIASPIVIGASGLSLPRFMLPNAAGAIVWAIGIGSAGYLFGAAFTTMLTHAKHYEEIAFAVLAYGIALLWTAERTQPAQDHAAGVGKGATDSATRNVGTCGAAEPVMDTKWCRIATRRLSPAARAPTTRRKSLP